MERTKTRFLSYLSLKLKLESYFHEKDEWWGFKICHTHETKIIAPVK